MRKIKTLRVLEDELGEVLKSGLSVESLYYSARWDEIQGLAEKEARRQDRDPPGDVRCAGFAWAMVSRPNTYTEADEDEKGNWIVYWR